MSLRNKAKKCFALSRHPLEGDMRFSAGVNVSGDL